MTARFRSFDHRQTISGQFYNGYNWYDRTNYYGEQGWCDDVVGHPDLVNPLDLHKTTKYSPLLNGDHYYLGILLAKLVTCPMACHYYAVPSPMDAYPTPNTAQGQEYAWETLAKSNPSLPAVNLPQAIGELKDLPSLVRGWGRNLLRSAAQGYLSWRWCLKPMIRDVSTLLDFTKTANNRFRELRSLRDGKALRRTVQLDTFRSVTNEDTSDRILHSEGAYIRGRCRWITTGRRWGTVNWKVAPDSPLLDMENDELMKFTRTTLQGCNRYGLLAAAWELVPWSWLIDWYSNCGEIINATNNAVGCVYDSMALMQHSKSEIVFKVTSQPDWVTLTGDFNMVRENKWRSPNAAVSPFPLAKLPILSKGQWSILSALAVLKGTR